MMIRLCRERIPTKGPIIQERNEWPAFTYEDGKYLITREPRGWVALRSVRPD